MKRVNYTGSSSDHHPCINRYGALSAGSMAVIVTTIIIVYDSCARVLQQTPPDKTHESMPVIPSERHIREPQKQHLEAGDDGLDIIPEDDTVRFIHRFDLHPTQLPNDQRYAARLSEFVDRWLTQKKGRREEWIVTQVLVHREVIPDEF